MLSCQYVFYCCRPGSIRADAFRGHGLSLLEKTTLRGLRTRAIPAGVTALLIRTGKAIYGRFLCHLIQLKNCVIGKCLPAARIHEDSLKKKTAFSACDVSQRSFPCPAGANLFGGTSKRSPKGLDETPQCEVRGGSLAARGKRSVYGLWLPK